MTLTCSPEARRACDQADHWLQLPSCGRLTIGDSAVFYQETRRVYRHTIKSQLMPMQGDQGGTNSQLGARGYALGKHHSLGKLDAAYPD
jgi:hypothetical protein